MNESFPYPARALLTPSTRAVCPHTTLGCGSVGSPELLKAVQGTDGHGAA